MRPRDRDVLCVEDDPDTAALMVYVFQRSGYQVTTASSADEALGLAAHRRYSLYLLNIFLPDKSGIELCRELRQRFPHTPIVIQSADTRQAIRRAALEAGAQAFWEMPVDYDALACQMTKLMAEAEARNSSLVMCETPSLAS